MPSESDLNEDEILDHNNNIRNYASKKDSEVELDLDNFTPQHEPDTDLNLQTQTNEETDTDQAEPTVNVKFQASESNDDKRVIRVNFDIAEESENTREPTPINIVSDSVATISEVPETDYIPEILPELDSEIRKLGATEKRPPIPPPRPVNIDLSLIKGARIGEGFLEFLVKFVVVSISPPKINSPKPLFHSPKTTQRFSRNPLPSKRYEHSRIHQPSTALHDQSSTLCSQRYST